MDTGKWELNDLEDGTGEIVIWEYDAEGEVDGSTIIVPSVYLDDDDARKTAQLLVKAPLLLELLEAMLWEAEAGEERLESDRGRGRSVEQLYAAGEMSEDMVAAKALLGELKSEQP